MGILQDNTFSDALKLAFAAGMLSRPTPHTFLGQVPIILLAPSICYDFMNPTTFTIPNPYPSILGPTKTLQPSYTTIPPYAMVPLLSLQALPHSVPSPHLPNPALRNVVERTVEYSVQGAVALLWILSALAKAVSQKDLALPREDKQLSSSESFKLDSLPSLPTEDDLLRVDMTELESIPLSELYAREELTVTPPAALRLVSSKTLLSLPPRSSHSETTLALLLEGHLPSEDLSTLLRIPDHELYFDPEHLGELHTKRPWR